MSCPVNFSTVKKGIENKAAQMLTQSGQFERVDQTSVRVTATTSDYNNIISNVNNAFREEIIKKHGELEYKIQPSDNLVNTYLNTSFKQKETTPIKKGVSELFEENFVLKNNGLELKLDDSNKKEIYDNYVNLMDRKREGKAISFEKFQQVFDNLQVFKYKNTFIFGEWDVKNNVFKGRLMSSPNIKELYSSLDVLFSNVDFVASVPSDIGKMLEKKGLYKLDVGKEYNFRGEEMIKNLYFINKELVEKIFKKPAEEVTEKDVKKYDKFFNYWDLIFKLKKEYEDKNYDNLLPILKEIGIYDYNAYKLVKKIKQGTITNEDTESVVKEVIKNSAINKVNIEKTDLINNPEIYDNLNTELNKILATYLSKYGIKTELLEDIQDELGVDSFAYVDILNKIIYADKNNTQDYPQQAGKVIAYMMQHNPIMHEITFKMKNLSMFKNLTKDELFEAVGDLISQELHKKTNTELPKSLLDSIKNLIRQFFDLINSVQLSRINKNIAFIADNILIQNQSLITQSTFKPGSVGKKTTKVSLEEALKQDSFANSIVEKMAKYFILTGSVTLSEQGTVYRPDENQVHDLDWVSSLPRDVSIKIFNQLYPNNKYIRNIYNEEYQTDTWLIAPKGYEVINLQIDNSKGTNKITGYDIVDKNGNIVSSYIPLSDSHTGKIEAKLIDIFTYENVTEEKTKNKEITLNSGTKLKIADWRNTFAAKLDFGRLKDIWDYNRFIPNDNIYKPEQTQILDSKQNNQFEIQYQLPQGRKLEEYVVSEKTIRDLAARISDRIGIPVRFESDRTKKYKGKLETFPGGVGAKINLAYATLDTPIHEILGHPIIRAIKNKQLEQGSFDNYSTYEINGKIYESLGNGYRKYDSNLTNFEDITKEEFDKNKPLSQLYQNLLKELEYGKGKEVFEQVKRDYVTKDLKYTQKGQEVYLNGNLITAFFNEEDAENYIKEKSKYTLEEQQEEAIVELLGLYTAERLDKVKDGKLISLLKRLLKEIKAFVKQLLGQKEVEIDKLPDNMTLGDIADLLAYSNSKLILPGNEVVYTTPDNQQFKTYAEASNHISDLVKSVEDVDLSNVKLPIRKKVTKAYEIPINEFIDEFDNTIFVKRNNKWYEKVNNVLVDDDNIVSIWNSNLSETTVGKTGIEGFLEKNKEYEQSKEIIEEWKKVNNIQYNPEEVYSRGQEFVSVVGAYSDFDVNLMMQNLLQHIEDNEKAGGEFIISAFTKPIDRQIGHLEGGGGKIKFKIYPQAKDIKWAANTDVYSGSVWDASEKVSKDKKSELLGVSYTKYPSLKNVNSVQPNLASIIDDLAHHHNELGITLTGNNFRLEYDEDILYSTKKIINFINSILDQRYGKLVKPEINKDLKNKIYKFNNQLFYTLQDAKNAVDKQNNIANNSSNPFTKSFTFTYEDIVEENRIGKQPTQTRENTTSIESVKNKTLNIFDNSKYVHPELGSMDGYNNFESDEFKLDTDTFKLLYNVNKKTYNVVKKFPNYWQAVTKSNLEYYSNIKGVQVSKIIEEQKKLLNEKIEEYNKKEYTSQALINTKIAKLKEVAKKYPRSLIRSEVRPIQGAAQNYSFDKDELPFQKIRDDKNILLQQKELTSSEANEPTMKLVEAAIEKLGISVQELTVEGGKKINANGFANAFKKLVGYVKDKKATTLPEEVMHVVVSLLKEKNPTLYRKFLGDITNYLIYDETLSLYKNVYKLDNGKPDIVKIKEEAIAKLLVEMLIKENEGITQKPELLAKTKSLWNQFVDWFTSFLNKLGVDYFDALLNPIATSSATNILTDDYSNVTVKNSNGEYFQISKEQELFNKLNNNSVKNTSKKEGVDADLEDIFNRLVDGNTGELRISPLPPSTISQSVPGDLTYYNELYSYMNDLFTNLAIYPKGTKFVNNVNITSFKDPLSFNFVAILPTGEVDVISFEQIKLNTFYQDDINVSTFKKVNAQLTAINNSLKRNYNVNKIRYSRAIPIQVNISKKENKVNSIEIGNVDPSKESKLYLSPIPSLEEKTIKDKLNNVLDKLVALFNSVSTRPAPNKNPQVKNEQLKSIFKTIRAIQTREDLEPLANQLKVLSNSANTISDKLLSYIEKNIPLTDEDVNRQSENILKIKEELFLMKELDVYLNDLLPNETEEQKQFISELNESVKQVRIAHEKIQKTIDSWGSHYIAKKYGVENLLNPEVSMASGNFSFTNFRTLEKLPTYAAEVLNKIIQNTAIQIENELQNEQVVFKELFDKVQEWGRGKSKLAFTELLMKKQNGKKVNKLIDKYNYKEFQEELKKAIERKDIAWVKANIDLESLKISLEKYRKNKIELIYKTEFDSDPEVNKIIQEDKIDEFLKSIDLNNNFIYLRFQSLKSHPSEKWYSKEYLELKKHKPILDFYNYILKWNEIASKTGYISYYDKYNFLPFVRKSFLDKLSYGGDFNFINNIMESMTINPNTLGYGSINPLTKEIENKVPAYFTNEIEDFSEDLFTNLILFIDKVINYKYKTSVEDNVKLLLEIEKNKGSLQTLDGLVTGQTLPSNDRNSQILQNFIETYFYDKKYITKEGDISNFTPGKVWNMLGSKVNKVLGKEVFPKIEDENRKINVVKVLDETNRWFRLKTLGLRIPTSVAVYLGGSAQAHINAGVWYKNSDFWKGQWDQFTARIIKSNEHHLALIEKFLPVEERLLEKIKKLSSSKYKRHDIGKVLMVLMLEADMMVSYANFMAFMNNTIVINGNVYNARDYYRNSKEYLNRYSLPFTERKKLEDNFETEIKNLIDKYGIEKADLSKLNQESVNKYKLLIRNVSKRNTGAMNSTDRTMINMTVLGRSFSMFKNWIPDQLDLRFGELMYNSSTEAFEYGRIRSFMKVLSQNYYTALSNTINVYKGNEKGIAILEKLWQEKSEEYRLKTGKELSEKMSKEQFFDMMRKNMKSSFKELQILAGLIALFISAKMMPPDDEDEETKNFYKYTMRILDKVQGEVSFFYNPIEFQNFVNQNLFPSLGVLIDGQRIIKDFMLYSFGTVFENDEWVDKAQGVKHIMKAFPISNSIAEIIPVFAPEWAKEHGIQLKEDTMR